MITKRGNRWRVVVQGGRDPVTQRRRQLSGSAATKADALKLESRFLREAVAGLDTDITVHKLVAPDTERIAPTVEETATIMLAAEVHDSEFLTFLWVAAEEGGRRGETLALRWEGVEFETGLLTIDSTVTKGDDGVQVRPRTKNNGAPLAVSDTGLLRRR